MTDVQDFAWNFHEEEYKQALELVAEISEFRSLRAEKPSELDIQKARVSNARSMLDEIIKGLTADTSVPRQMIEEIRRCRDAAELVGPPAESQAFSVPPVAPSPQPELTVTQLKPNPAPAFAAQVDQSQTTAPSESVQAAPADASDPLTTSDIAYCFAGLRWQEQEWKKPLGDKPKWLQSCIAIPGKRGVHETRWNPVLIGAALVQDGHAKPNSVRARFQSKPQLSPWLEAWKTYEADYLDTE